MAENKKSFVLYCDLITVVEKLVLQDRLNNTNYGGELFLVVLKYVNDRELVDIDFLVELAFEPIKLSLKRDLVKYELYKGKQRINGAKGGAPKGNNNAKKTTQTTQRLNKQPKQPVSVSVSVSDNNIINNTVPLQKAKGLIDFDSLLMFLNLKTGKNLRVINKATRQSFTARLKDKYTKEDIRNAITNACIDPFHKENNFKHLTPDYFSRAKSLDLHAFKKINGKVAAEVNPYFPKN